MKHNNRYKVVGAPTPRAPNGKIVGYRRRFGAAVELARRTGADRIVGVDGPDAGKRWFPSLWESAVRHPSSQAVSS